MSCSFRPVLVWAGGSRAEGFSSRTHAFYSGETVEKQIVAVNDSRRDLKLTVNWTLGGRSGSVPVEVAAGRRAFVPFTLTMPQVEKRTELVLKLSVSGVDPKRLDVQDFPLQVFPPDRIKPGKTVVLFDPVGETRQAFEKLGIPFVKGDADAAGTIVIGRGSLAKLPYATLAKLLDQVRAGAALVVMAQPDLSPFGLRVQPRGVRRMFPVGSPELLAGLEPVDFTDWRGGYSFLEPDPKYSEATAGEYPEEPFRRGNRGSIASLMLEKPHTGGFRHWLEGEFDLNYAFLTELAEGRGHILFCQLDLAGVPARSGRDGAAAPAGGVEPGSGTRCATGAGDRRGGRETGRPAECQNRSAGGVDARGGVGAGPGGPRRAGETSGTGRHGISARPAAGNAEARQGHGHGRRPPKCTVRSLPQNWNGAPEPAGPTFS